MDCEKHHTKYLTKRKKGSKIKIFCLFFILHEINSANAKLIAMVVCLLFSFSRYGFDDTLSEKNARLFPSTCWQITDFVSPVSKKVKKSLVKVVHRGHLVMSEPWPRLAIVPFMLTRRHRFSQILAFILFPFLLSPQSFPVSSSQYPSNKKVTNVQVVHIFCDNYWWQPADCAFCRLHQFQFAYD